jgi:SH3-like domain-containing protein
MRSGPGLKYPIKFEFRKKKYPMKIISEYYNWRQVITYNNIKGWIATHLLSSVKTGLILKTTFLKISPSNQSLSKAKLLPQLLIEIKKCNTEWCKVIIVKNDKFDGWVEKKFIWGSTKNHIQ